LVFASFIFIFARVTRKPIPESGMEAMGDRLGPWLFLTAIGHSFMAFSDFSRGVREG
jgi:hypothetical protein